VRAFEAELQKCGVAHEIHVYPDSQHAFFNDTRPHAYNPQAASDAWIRTLEWLVRHLVRAS
jgi:carboxymethylenebutenolidase